MPRAPFDGERDRTPRTRHREMLVPIPRRFKASRVGAPDGRGGAKIALEMADEFTPEERAALAPYFTNLDGPVFALVNLPEVVKGALFARYSRSPKSLRRLFLDEFRTAGGSADDALRQRYVAALDGAFDSYREWLPRMRAFYETKYPRDPAESDTVYRMTIRAKALDTLRGMLPAATISHVGIYGTGQAYEQLLLRMRAHPLAEVRAYAELMLAELRRVIPAFLKRVDLPERGGVWSRYLAATHAATQEVAARLLDPAAPEPREEVTLTDFDPDGEVKVVAAALYAVSALSDDELLERARKMSLEERRAVLDAYVGERLNRRHRPGRAFERTSYRFDILGDYGAFRDLQRHRLLTLEWQRLTPRHGSIMPEAVAEAGAEPDWSRVLVESAELHDAIAAAGLPEVASYAVAMAYRVRFYMEMNAREAMHVIELRTTPQGHPAYRRICQAMHRLIAERAGHRAIAAAMTFADHSAVELEL